MFVPFLLVAAQQVWLEEDFSSGVPPTGWDEQINSANAGWEKGSFVGDSAYHNDFTTVSDNYLVTPVMDFSLASEVWLHWDQYNKYTQYRDHHYIAASLDDGLTWIRIGEDVAKDGNCSWSVDLSAAAGFSSVRFAFEYTGQFSSQWTIDNVSVTDSIEPPAPPIVSTVAHPTNGQTYHLLAPSTWDAAEGAAKALGGHLVEINDAAENSWVQSTFGTGTDLWIGLNDVSIEGTFFWSVGRLPSYTNWALFEPNHLTNISPLGEQFVAMHGSGGPFPGKWYDYHRTTLNNPSGYLCGVAEIPITPGPTLSVANLLGGQTCTVRVTGGTPNNVAVFSYSLVGGGPTPTLYGPVLLTAPFNILPISLGASGAGSYSAQVPVPATGKHIWLHGADAASTTLLNALSLTIG